MRDRIAGVLDEAGLEVELEREPPDEAALELARAKLERLMGANHGRRWGGSYLEGLLYLAPGCALVLAILTYEQFSYLYPIFLALLIVGLPAAHWLTRRRRERQQLYETALWMLEPLIPDDTPLNNRLYQQWQRAAANDPGVANYQQALFRVGREYPVRYEACLAVGACEVALDERRRQLKRSDIVSEIAGS